MTPNRKIHDGDLWTLASGNPDAPKAEFLLNSTDGRIGYRITDRYGRGILLEEAEMIELQHLIVAAFRAKSEWAANKLAEVSEENHLYCPACDQECENCPLD